MTRHARYDRAAEWFSEYTSAWGTTPAFGFVADDLSGQAVLDMACGYGRISAELARRGARVTAVDLSGALIAQARAAGNAELDVEFIHGDVTDVDWWNNDPFDGVICDMSLMDIDDLPGAMRVAATVLRPGGWFIFSLFHPCYPGGPTGSADGLPSWPPDLGYAHEGWWSTGGQGVRGHVGANHRMLSTYLNAAIDAGLAIEWVGERETPVPTFLIIRCSRPRLEQ